MLHVFHIYILHMLQWLYTYVVKCMFQIFHLVQMYVASFYLDVAYVLVVIHICCKCLLKMFHLCHMYVASVLYRCCIYCSGHIHMLQEYVVNILFFRTCVTTNALYCKCCMSRHRKWAQQEEILWGVAVPALTGIESCMVAPTCAAAAVSVL
jgi:hypothetical protein